MVGDPVLNLEEDYLVVDLHLDLDERLLDNKFTLTNLVIVTLQDNHPGISGLLLLQVIMMKTTKETPFLLFYFSLFKLK
jgi:hypothetical protein